ncbi:hypothetical protein BDV95DRAFT_596803 [Massariosphaeria phaeospora]|uniref:Uncharacterized protein n=1 Tax=Massariosphaeria phaeospora TaxID=100035 RepID=A0A7C8MGW1_9PLEO|nr:hypothetical protein BDV95DRAFT_596803 [Massariosphaeria phaeospora]
MAVVSAESLSSLPTYGRFLHGNKNARAGYFILPCLCLFASCSPPTWTWRRIRKPINEDPMAVVSAESSSSMPSEKDCGVNANSISTMECWVLGAVPEIKETTTEQMFGGLEIERSIKRLRRKFKFKSCSNHAVLGAVPELKETATNRMFGGLDDRKKASKVFYGGDSAEISSRHVGIRWIGLGGHMNPSSSSSPPRLKEHSHGFMWKLAEEVISYTTYGLACRNKWWNDPCYDTPEDRNFKEVETWRCVVLCLDRNTSWLVAMRDVSKSLDSDRMEKAGNEIYKTKCLR